VLKPIFDRLTGEFEPSDDRCPPMGEFAEIGIGSSIEPPTHYIYRAFHHFSATCGGIRRSVIASLLSDSLKSNSPRVCRSTEIANSIRRIIYSSAEFFITWCRELGQKTAECRNKQHAEIRSPARASERLLTRKQTSKLSISAAEMCPIETPGTDEIRYTSSLCPHESHQYFLFSNFQAVGV